MISRDELNQYLANLYQFQDFADQDFCENGLQVEGKEEIRSIVFGVSFNLPFLKQTIAKKADALIVHHGIFQKGVFKLKEPLKQKVKMLLEKEISLFGIHLPMDAHPELGHNALLLSSISAGQIERFGNGFLAENTGRHKLDRILDIFHNQLHTEAVDLGSQNKENAFFSFSTVYGFEVLRNGPAIPKKIVVYSGESSDSYEEAVEKGVDTFFAGEIKERTLPFSYETQTNFVNLGHYFSEKPGVLALKKRIDEDFDVQTEYIEIPNPV